jgi:hypothetical protein
MNGGRGGGRHGLRDGGRYGGRTALTASPSLTVAVEELLPGAGAPAEAVVAGWLVDMALGVTSATVKTPNGLIVSRL